MFRRSHQGVGAAPLSSMNPWLVQVRKPLSRPLLVSLMTSLLVQVAIRCLKRVMAYQLSMMSQQVVDVAERPWRHPRLQLLVHQMA